MAAVACVSLLAGASGQAEAQLARVGLTGTVESNVSLDRLTVGGEASTTFSYGSRYAPSLGGFVLDPRILTFSLSGSFTDQTTDVAGRESQHLVLEPYQLSLGVLPQSRHSFAIEAGRSITESRIEVGDLGTEAFTTTTDRYSLGWRFLGAPILPETTLRLTREIVSTEQALIHTPEASVEKSTLSLRLYRPIFRFQPVLTYSAELTDRTGLAVGSGLTGLTDESLVHRVRYEDRVYISERTVLPLNLEWVSDPDFRRGDTSITLTGALSPTLDGSTTVGYGYFESGESRGASHTTSASGQLVKRFTADLVATGTANGSIIAGPGDLGWTGGTGAALTAAPLTHLRTVSDAAVQFSESGSGLNSFYRAHVGASSTILPRHTLSLDYFINRAEFAGGSSMSHTSTAGVTSVAVPFTTISAGASMEQQLAGGERHRWAGNVGANANPFEWLSLRAAAESFVETSAGTGEAAKQQRGLGADAGFRLKPFWWLELGMAGRHAVIDVTGEDRPGERVTQALTANVAMRWGALSVDTTGFLERDGEARHTRRGVRGTLGYRFRVWTIAVDGEMSEAESARLTGQNLERQRVLLRLSRPLNFSLY